MEVGGYAARIKGWQNMFQVYVFVASYFLIVVAPIPIAAAIYLMLTYAAARWPEGRRLLVMKPKAMVSRELTRTVAHPAGGGARPPHPPQRGVSSPR
jgi:hypothetical protein